MAEFEAQVGVVRRRPWLFAAVWFAIGLGEGVLGFLLKDLRWWIAFLGFVAACMAIGLVRRRFDLPRTSKTVRMRARVDRAGLWLDERLAIERRRIRGGHLQPSLGAPATVHIEGSTRAERLAIEVADDHQGLALLHALHLDPSSAKATFRSGGFDLYSRWDEGWTTLAFFSFWMLFYEIVGRNLCTLGLQWSVLGSLFNLVFFFAFLRPMQTKILVGSEGVREKFPLFRHFCPFREVAKVVRTDTGAVLVLKNEKIRRIVLDGRHPEPKRGDLFRFLYRTTRPDPDRHALLTSIEQHFEAFKSREASKATHESTQATALLARGGRTPEDWMHAVQALGAGSGGYRETAVTDEQLWQLVDGVTADPTARAGAAVALRQRADNEARARLRIAAEAVESPRTRVALEAAASEDDEALLRALAECKDAASAKPPLWQRLKRP